MDAFYPILFFNEKYSLREVLGLREPDIIDLFQRFAADVNDANPYGVHEEARAYIQDAVAMITTIHDSKANKTLAKDQSFGFILEDPDARPITFGGLTVGYQGKEFELRTLYDIVAWIFSVVGNVPNGATRENYYYPLMVIARVFCTKMTSRAKAPEMWSVMWFKQTVDNRLVTRVLLGANLDKPAIKVKEDTKDFRKDLLKKAQVLFWKDGTPAPAQDEGPRGVVGQDFGHCAESYPLLFICSLGTGEDRPKIRESAEGISANTEHLYDDSHITIKPYKVADSDGTLKVNPKIMPPCYNCVTLMLMNGLTLANFDYDLYNTRPNVPRQ